MADVVNIELVAPSPIVFVVGDQELRCSALISAATGFALRRLMLQVAEAIQENDADAFEKGAVALQDQLLEVFREHHPDMETLPFGVDQMMAVATKIWQRCLGATDETLQKGDDEEEADAGPPPNRSTRRRGSAASSKPTAARRRSGSSSR